MEYLQKFNYKILGNLQSEKHLVFLHGMMGSGINWTRIAKTFHKEYQILLFDQRGHGRSFKPKTSYHPRDYAEDLYKIINELGWDKINLVGHSMGGRNALSFAGTYPERLNKLVIEDISPSVKLKSIDEMKTLINSVPVPFKDKESAKTFFKEDFLETFSDKKKGQVIGQFFNMNIIEKLSGVADWRFYKPGILETLELGRREEAWPIVDELSCQTLYVYGENSNEISKEDITRIELNSCIKTQCIKNSGHWVHFDQPANFANCLEQFLA